MKKDAGWYLHQENWFMMMIDDDDDDVCTRRALTNTDGWFSLNDNSILQYFIVVFSPGWRIPNDLMTKENALVTMYRQFKVAFSRIPQAEKHVFKSLQLNNTD